MNKKLISRCLVLLFVVFLTSVLQAETIDYTYDSLNRVIKEVHSSGEVIMYSYDAAGNRTQKVIAPVCFTDTDCDDGDFCNGAEVCDNGTCAVGEDPCADNATHPFCDEIDDRCLECLEDAHCDDFCVDGACVECRNNADCDDSNFCNGEETCVDGLCAEGTSPCGAGQYCDEDNDTCVECLENSHCDDGDFCNGEESCVNGACVAGADPCEGDTPFCDETGDRCVECLNDANCDDGAYCNGAEACAAGACVPGGAPCNEGEKCDEDGDQCLPEWDMDGDGDVDKDDKKLLKLQQKEQKIVLKTQQKAEKAALKAAYCDQCCGAEWDLDDDCDVDKDDAKVLKLRQKEEKTALKVKQKAEKTALKAAL
jgi:YD repeat-containing protein